MPSLELEKEVRFAVVLYGGVSLAIYINGVTQELLRMVRATAADPADPTRLLHPQAQGSEQVYRKLGQILGACDSSPRPHADDATPVRARFVVDIISGTSAGGINGVFLAKALAQDQSLDPLKQLWVDEADIALLINDPGSAVDNIEPGDPPRSLLNSRRMYWKLYEALAGMESPAAAGASPYLDELDLFITATDLSGRLLPLPLTGGRVFERRHRAVFHFRYASNTIAPRPENHFTSAYSPLLAFAARCTSSFPVAFEPMALTDALDVLRERGIVVNDEQAAAVANLWREVAVGYTTDTGLPSVDFPHRAFADGGYLDNKPFSFAIHQMQQRHAPLPVERKLLYVEPAPEQAHRILERSRRPDAIENAWLAISTLPRYETIRQDLEDVLARNEEVRRLRSLVNQIETAAAGATGAPGAGRLQPGEWVEMDTPDLLAAFGRGYLTYHRLKVSWVTDDLTALLRAHFGVEAGSAYGRSLRFMVRVWRDRQYGLDSPHARQRGKADRDNRFLLDFDIGYRIRRVRYLKRMVDESICSTSHTQLGRDIASRVPADLRDDFLAELRAAGRALILPYRTLAALGAAAEDLAVLGGLAALRQALDLDPGEETARKVLRERASMIDEAADRVRRRYRAGFEKASAEALSLLDPRSAPNPGARLAREIFRDLYDRFEDYDSITLPVLHDGGIGELSVVDVTRISPLDATRLVDETAGKQRKLRGAALGNFGAFLDRGWRENDMLWGRLDGAERIITALLPADADQPLREQLIDEAHNLILREEMDRLLPASPAPPRERLFQYMAAQRTEPERDLAARSIARSTTVTGRMLDRIARDRRWEGLPFPALARAGRILWGLVEVATPRSLNELLFQHWIKLIYLVEAALIVAGFFLPEAQALGVKLLLWTFAIHLAVALLRDYLVESRRVVYAAAAVALLGAMGLTVLGALEVWNVAASGRTARDLAGPWWLARLTGLLGAVTLVMGWWMDRQPARLRYGAGQRPPAPVIALEFASTPAEFLLAAGEVWHPNRRVFHAIREAAAWFFSALALTFIGLAALAWSAGHPIAAVGITAFAIASALFEWRQTGALGAALHKPVAAAHPPRLARLACGKWASCFAALGAAACLSLSRASDAGCALWLNVAGGIAAIAAVVGLAGLAWKRLRLGLIPLAGIGLVLALALWTVLLIVSPELLYAAR